MVAGLLSYVYKFQSMLFALKHLRKQSVTASMSWYRELGHMTCHVASRDVIQIVFENDDNNGKFLYYLQTEYSRIDDCRGRIVRDTSEWSY